MQFATQPYARKAVHNLTSPLSHTALSSLSPEVTKHSTAGHAIDEGTSSAEEGRYGHDLDARSCRLLSCRRSAAWRATFTQHNNLQHERACIQLRVLGQHAVVRHSVVQAGAEAPHLALLPLQPMVVNCGGGNGPKSGWLQVG